jgi:hypothetical protein
MRLLTGNQTRRLDTEHPVPSPNVYTGAFPWSVSESKTKSLNIYPTATSSPVSDPDAFLLGQTTSPYSPIINGQPVQAYGTFVEPYGNTELLTNRFTADFSATPAAKVWDTCRGNTPLHRVGSWNYYQGFHPFGYFSPSYGEIASLSEATDYYGSVAGGEDNGSCADITRQEYNELRGIVSSTIWENDNLNPVNVFQNKIKPKIQTIHSPYEECPPLIIEPFYFEEIVFRYAAGTYAGGLAGNVYNHNPIPSALDFNEMQLTSRYRLVEVLEDRGEENATSVLYITGENEAGDNGLGEMFTISNYNTGESGNHAGFNNDLLLNNKLSYNGLCDASNMEGSTAKARQLSSRLELTEYDPFSPLNAGSLAPTFTSNPWEYWNFVFKENADYVPFENNFNGSANTRRSSKGTALFKSKKADDAYWWENRQCPEVVDFLPWTMGSTVYDCPRDYFEVPYYSAIGKFGYYGTRFQTSCKMTNRSVANDVNFVKAGIPVFETRWPLTKAWSEYSSVTDTVGSNSTDEFRNLLAVAHREQQYSEWSFNNVGFYLVKNSYVMSFDPELAQLKNEFPSFTSLYDDLVHKHLLAFRNLPNFITGLDGSATAARIDNPYVPLDSSAASQDYSHYLKSPSSQINLLDWEYSSFLRNVKDNIPTKSLPLFESIIGKYGKYIVNEGIQTPSMFTLGQSILWEEYNNIESGKEERIRTRGLLNFANGNPVDLFPTNHIYYGMDEAEDYRTSHEWGRRWGSSISSTKMTAGDDGLSLPQVERRYFEGTFTKKGRISEIQSSLITLTSNDVPGLPITLDEFDDKQFSIGAYFRNINCGRTAPTPSFVPVTDGDGVSDSQNPNAVGVVRNWSMLGYSDIGRLDSNFSCFTPIFVQQPKNTYCKVGQQPTFRSLAIDYHTLPEDKIKSKYPETWFWANELKLVDSSDNYLYPMKYKWGRIPISSTSEYTQGIFDSAAIEWSDEEGEWCCLEGQDGPDCTFIHPQECWSTTDEAGYAGPASANYKFKQGVKAADATSFSYFCLSSGRFGVRGSDPFVIEADSFVMSDLAYLNGGGSSAVPKLYFELTDTVNNGALQNGGAVNYEMFLQTDSSYVSAGYDGIAYDPDVCPEEIVYKKRYLRAGGGMNLSFGFNGNFLYRGFARSYVGETLDDSRGLESTSEQPVDYGILLQYKGELTDQAGGWLYGYSHLPVCANSEMAVGEKGVRTVVKIDKEEMQHAYVSQKAEIPLSSRYAPMDGNKPDIVHVGQLYNFNRYSPNAITTMGMTSTWQFHQNLGAVKRFGKQTSFAAMNVDFRFNRNISASIPTVAQEVFDYVQDEIITPTDLAGPNCGYTATSVGRKMAYFVEAFDRFYVICNDAAKYNVPNPTFVAPGLRFGDAGFQYTWLGQPSDSYLERKGMYGPYAYQWKVQRHNRDRLGNGLSLGFYSMGWADQYSLMHDIPAVHGLYLKNNSNPATAKWAEDMKTLRDNAFPNSRTPPRKLLLGRRGTSSEGYGYGHIRANCEDGFSVNNTLNSPQSDSSYGALCSYFQYGQRRMDGSEYFCSLENSQEGACFDPCLSIRYSHGFLPGGKRISHMCSPTREGYEGGGKPLYRRITANGKDVALGRAEDVFSNAKKDLIVNDRSSVNGVSTVLRGPANTPYAKKVREGSLSIHTPFETYGDDALDSLNEDRSSNRLNWSIDPCEPGGTEHCNFNTPTVHLGGNVSPTASVSFLTMSNNDIFESLA